MEPNSVRATPADTPGELVRRTRQAKRMTLCQLGKLTGYSTAQVSRYERGISPLTDMVVLRRFAAALSIPPEVLGLMPEPGARHSHPAAPITPYPRLPGSRVTERIGADGGEDTVRRRQMLALTLTAAAAASAPTLTGAEPVREAALGDVLVGRLRDAMLGLPPATASPATLDLHVELARAVADFHLCRYSSLAVRLPCLLKAAHAAPEGPAVGGVLAQSYLLVTRVLVKLDEQQLGWMAADRARQLAEAAGDPLAIAEAARQLAVLARRAGWNDQAMTIALSAADAPALRDAGPDGAAARGLLIQSAAYTAARDHDQTGMRKLTAEAAAIAKELGGTRLRTHGGFSAATVQLHLVSAEDRAGDPSAAIAAADRLTAQALPTIERRARFHVDVATAYARWGRRDQCLNALLAAEVQAPEETHARPAVKTLISGLLASGRTSPELRGLAARAGVLTS
ncbi:helix-turn-helix transcriptional regulator [Streptomyces sp. 110]|uniref:Helix-turn-helix transcriptional regulator n=1 Tax=Streptomyces endocoffeicus TaxID=2898945 RepID=A0ABS1PSK1_9ACTN|nr:helix-turn-helix transcriptional regulator [Streptomyces endocoffeicus]MBL1115412.1 helix-turn-helix transcriptional regulator [Streptomyces endocoffeicus]